MVLSGGIKGKHWPEMGTTFSYFLESEENVKFIYHLSGTLTA